MNEFHDQIYFLKETPLAAVWRGGWWMLKDQLREVIEAINVRMIEVWNKVNEQTWDMID